MGYVDYQYYVNNYLLGKDPVVPEKIFSYWEKQARTEVDQATYGRISSHIELVSEQVKDCVCELAELLYQADRVTQEEIQQGAAGPLVSYSNDGESGTFDLSQSAYTETGKGGKIKEILYRYLGNTGLMYAGI